MGDGEEQNKEENHRFSITVPFPGVVNLNVGGKHFSTRLTTLRRYPESMLAVMFSGRHHLDTDADGNYFIDRDGTYFHHILNFLRHDDVPPADVAEAVIKDAMYYGIDMLVEQLKNSPALFTEYVVRENIRTKLENYPNIVDDMINLAKDEAERNGVTHSTVRLVVTKNQPIPRDLQFSKQVYKQYYRRFQTYKTFEECLGKFFVRVPSETVKGHSNAVMDQVSSCLVHDLLREGYKVSFRAESIREENRIKTVTWCDEEFHLFSSIHAFTFNWLDTDKGATNHRHQSANF